MHREVQCKPEISSHQMQPGLPDAREDLASQGPRGAAGDSQRFLSSLCESGKGIKALPNATLSSLMTTELMFSVHRSCV